MDGVIFGIDIEDFSKDNRDTVNCCGWTKSLR